AKREYGSTLPADTAGLISAIIGAPFPDSDLGGCPDRPGPGPWPAAPGVARACCTFVRDAAETDSGSRSAREAVAVDTPAVPAISDSRTCRCSGGDCPPDTRPFPSCSLTAAPPSSKCGR